MNRQSGTFPEQLRACVNFGVMWIMQIEEYKKKSAADRATIMSERNKSCYRSY